MIAEALMMADAEHGVGTGCTVCEQAIKAGQAVYRRHWLVQVSYRHKRCPKERLAGK